MNDARPGDDYVVPAEFLTGDPVADVELLARYAGLKVCARTGCSTRWVGGRANRRYCSPACRQQVLDDRKAHSRQHAREQAKGLAHLPGTDEGSDT